MCLVCVRFLKREKILKYGYKITENMRMKRKNMYFCKLKKRMMVLDRMR